MGPSCVSGIVAVADAHALGALDQSVDDRRVHLLVHVEPLDRRAHLARSSGRRPRRGPSTTAFGIDVVEDDRRIVAAELEGDALQVAGGVLRDLLAGGDAASEGDLADLRMLPPASAPTLPGPVMHVDHSGRQDVFRMSATSSERERRELRRLGDHRVAGEQCRRELPRQQDHREIPRRDGGDDAERLADDLDALLAIVLQHLRRESRGRRSS